MRVAVCSKSELARLKKILLENGFKIVNKKPDWVLCYGGDGTILYAERKYPAIPKLAIKKTKICHKCDIKSAGLEESVKAVKANNYSIAKEMKLEATYKNKKLAALNEIQVHTQLPTKAIRFSLYVDDKVFENLVGDGVIIATPFGSTAYYQSTGGMPFDSGIGISFNNLHMKSIASFVVSEHAEIKVKIERGLAWLIADNDENFIPLNNGDVFVVRKSPEKAQFMKVYV